MSYLGRVVGVGATQNGNPVLLYGLSGRSPSSRSRIAVVHGSRVSIEPYGEMTSEQRVEAQRLVYDAMMTSNTNAVGVVSNGKQTGSIYRGYMRRTDAGNAAKNVISRALRRWGHEGKVGDRYNTPRIAGMVDVFMSRLDYGGNAALGIVTEGNEKDGPFADDVVLFGGLANTVSTYTGESAEPEAPKFQTVAESFKTRRIEGRTAQELAEEMYESIDPEFVVASAAALWVPSEGWKLAVKNKN